MAVPNSSYDQVSAITRRKFIPKLVDNIFDSNILLQRGRKKFLEKLDGGTKIVQPLNYAVASASGWYAGADTLSNVDNDVITAAEYDWKQIYASIAIKRIDELKNAGASQVLSLVKNKVKIAEKTMADSIGTGLFNAGTTTDAIIGLRAIVDAASTIGGISQSTYSWWQAQEDTSSTVLSLAVMQALFNDAAIGNDKPSLIVTTRDIFDSYYALLQPQQRFVNDEVARGGFSSLMFNGVPVVVDSHCPSSHMFMLNEKYLHLFVHKDEDFRFEPFMKPINQNVKVAKIYSALALGSSNNRMHGKLSAITS